MSGVDHFYTKVVGVTFKNADGTSRQKVIRETTPGEELFFGIDHDPKHPDAVAVVTRGGRQLGHLEAELAGEVSQAMRAGWKYDIRLIERTGGEPGKPTLGANVLVIRRAPGVSDAKRDEYANAHAAEWLADLRARNGLPAKSGGGCLSVVLVMATAAGVFWCWLF